MTVKSRSKKFEVNDSRFPNEHIKNRSNVVNDLTAIDVNLRYMPTWEEAKAFLPDAIMSTWAAKSDEYDFTEHQKDALMYRALRKKFLPQYLEFVNVVFSVDGMTAHDLSHTLRNRNASFAVECTGDNYKNRNDVSMPEAYNELGLSHEYEALATLQMDLYAKAINSGMSVQDARLILPRGIHQFVMLRMTLGNALGLITQRIDTQIQPRSDNVFALQLAVAMCKKWPLLATLIDFDDTNWYYVKETTTNFASRFFKPLPQNDKFENDDIEFKFDADPLHIPGQKTFIKLLNKYKDELLAIRKQAEADYPWVFDEDYR
jgi:hypothetical protein